MQASEHQLVVQRRPQPPAPVNSATSGSPALLDPLELESFKLIIDASLRVYARPHFFTWTQGLLQNLVKHEALICALRDAEPMSFHVESFSTSPLEPALFSDMFRQDTSMVPHIIKTWEENSYQPVVCDTGKASPYAQSALSREFDLGVTGGSDFHGDVKPGIRLGSGAGNLNIPLSVLEQLREIRPLVS